MIFQIDKVCIWLAETKIINKVVVCMDLVDGHCVPQFHGIETIMSGHSINV